MTLEPGDVILTGTPAGSRPVEPGDVVEVELDGRRPRAQPDRRGAPSSRRSARCRSVSPRRARGGARRQRARGRSRSPHEARSAALRTVSTATLTRAAAPTRGIAQHVPRRACARRGPTCGCSATRTRCATSPLREDVRDADTAELNAQKRAIEAIGPGEVLVIEARGEAGAGTIGDILAARALRARRAGHRHRRRRCATRPASPSSTSPPTTRRRTPPSLGLAALPARVQRARSPARGVLVMPGDVIVGDAEGVIVIPAALAEEVARDALEQEEREAWALERVQAGESIRGVFPLSDGAPRRVRGLARTATGAHDEPVRRRPIAIRGAITPLVTPFHADGSLDLDALAPLIDWQLEQGTHGISVGGSTGEPTSQTVAERIAVMRAAAAAIDGRVPFLPGTGTALMARR